MDGSLEEIAESAKDVLKLFDVRGHQQRGERAQQRLELRVELMPQVSCKGGCHLQHRLESDAWRGEEVAPHGLEDELPLMKDQWERE